ncbi:DUF308 domain-containing protein [Paraburkholderia sp. SG-MS1]|uniref:DUF308 domain-containing protein n=1 Tax=Paraburkholderia sp. SG-MS1 TaxID=2023741 RepID=UPI00406CE9A6
MLPGLGSLAAGVIPIFVPAMTALVLVLVTGVHAIATGVFEFITASRLRSCSRHLAAVPERHLFPGVQRAGARLVRGRRDRARLGDSSACHFTGALLPALGFIPGAGSATGRRAPLVQLIS